MHLKHEGHKVNKDIYPARRALRRAIFIDSGGESLYIEI